jgi:hypothetical protein
MAASPAAEERGSSDAARKATPVFLAEEEADAAALRRLGARVQCVGDTVGSVGNDVIPIARSGGRELLIGMNLGGTGRFIERGANGSVEATVQGHTDPLGLLNEIAHDILA